MDRYDDVPGKGMRIVTEPEEVDRSFFKRPLKLIKRRVMEKKAEANFERSISEYTKKYSAAEELWKMH